MCVQRIALIFSAVFVTFALQGNLYLLRHAFSRSQPSCVHLCRKKLLLYLFFSPFELSSLSVTLELPPGYVSTQTRLDGSVLSEYIGAFRFREVYSGTTRNTSSHIRFRAASGQNAVTNPPTPSLPVCWRTAIVISPGAFMSGSTGMVDV